MKEKKLYISPNKVILFSYLFVILVGTILLYLPQARYVKIPLIDLLFTSTSCTCVTGIRTVPIAYFTDFGKIVIMCLIQLGGVGLMTLSLFFVSLFLELGMATQIMAGEMFEFKWSRTKFLASLIVITTFVCELLGAIYLYFPFREFLPAKRAAFYAIFHSISAFCNTGITLFDGGLARFHDNYTFLAIIASLVFIGSIGFVVWIEVAKKIRSFFISSGTKFRFSLHTKVIFLTTAVVTLFGGVLTWLLERENTLRELSVFHGIFISFFNTISLRSAGFELFSIGSIMPATVLIFMLLMFIGSSPGSIGGGIKTTTFALFVATVATIANERDEVEIFGRTVPQDQVFRAISIIALSAGWIFLSTFILLIFEEGFSFIQVFFEVVSALSLCGLPTHVTASFSIFGKLMIMFTMLLGRMGTLTLVFAFWAKKKKQLFNYPEEQIIIG